MSYNKQITVTFTANGLPVTGLSPSMSIFHEDTNNEVVTANTTNWEERTGTYEGFYTYNFETELTGAFLFVADSIIIASPEQVTRGVFTIQELQTGGGGAVVVPRALSHRGAGLTEKEKEDLRNMVREESIAALSGIKIPKGVRAKDFAKEITPSFESNNNVQIGVMKDLLEEKLDFTEINSGFGEVKSMVEGLDLPGAMKGLGDFSTNREVEQGVMNGLLLRVSALESSLVQRLKMLDMLLTELGDMIVGIDQKLSANNKHEKDSNRLSDVRSLLAPDNE